MSMTQEQIKRGRGEWDWQIARSNRSLQFWRVLALLAVGGLFLSLWYIGNYIQKPKLIPYVVEIKDDQIAFKGVIQTQKLNITDAVVRNYLIRIVGNLRTISSDIVVLKNNLRDVYSITTPAAQRQVTEMIGSDKPFEQSAHEIRRDVQFTLFERIAEKTWRVEWIEQIRVQGTLKDTFAMAGTFTYSQGFPNTEIEAEQNPFGFYISEFFISQRRGQ
jgi:type IV secretion system protein VirB5